VFKEFIDVSVRTVFVHTVGACFVVSNPVGLSFQAKKLWGIIGAAFLQVGGLVIQPTASNH